MTFGGRYRVEQELGRGARGIVYRARDLESGEEVAVKLMRADADDEQESPSARRARFEQEVRLLMSLDHPAIVRARDWGLEGNEPYLVMELVPGQNLTEAVVAAGRDLRRIAAWIRQAAEGLTYAHGRGVTHRDIKPQNLLVGSTGEIKILDFGLARAQGQRLTATGVLLGTLFYLAPEQTMSSNVGPPADWYALGASLFECCTGRVPFHSTDALAVAFMHCGDAPPRPRSLNPDIPPALESLILRLLAKDPDERPDGPEVIRDLDALVWQPPAEPVPAAADDPPFVGRKLELSRMITIVDRWASEGPGQLFLAGPTGSGRTRMLRRAQAYCGAVGLGAADWNGDLGAAAQVICVDDLDRLDPPAQAALLARAGLVSTLCTNLPWSPLLRRALADGQVIALDPLTPRDIRRLLGSWLGSKPSMAIAQRWHSETGGLPGLVVERVRSQALPIAQP